MKTAGLICFASALTLMGYFHGEKIRKTMICMEELFRLIQHIRFEIEVFSREQGEIFRKFQSDFLERCGFLEQLIRETENNPTGSLFRSLDSFLSRFPILPRWKEELLHWAESFGMRSRTKELEETERLELFLEKSLQTEREEMKNRIRLSGILGLTAGIGILILLF